MALKSEQRYRFETGVYRPPSEGGSSSLLVRFTRNCPWNNCTFCGMYKIEKFQVRSVDEIKQDIDAVAALCSDLARISLASGHGATLTRGAAVELIRQNPGLEYHQGFAMVYEWLLAGGKTAFLQDANSIIMKTDPLVEALKHLRQTFPTLQRVTSYARAKTLAQKSTDELKAIRQAGLDRVHIGLESGDDDVLKKVRKGTTAEGHIKGGQKALAAGFQVSEYWMPGLGGAELSDQHAANTARVLNEINPHYIRSRPFHPWPGTPVADEVHSGDLHLLPAIEHLREVRNMVAALDVTSKVCFDHSGNYWKNSSGGYLLSLSYEGYQFPDRKEELLALIDEGLA
jgi:radical SAM superfamily enzyme YgiQ (UPF0313 family)